MQSNFDREAYDSLFIGACHEPLVPKTKDVATQCYSTI
jgi:hypothetical protein